MNITPTTLKLNQLFGASGEQFSIPAYQRRYSWEKKQVIELYSDIDYLQEGHVHLLGSIVCLTQSHQAGINKLELVDGQQRITSLTILFKAIKDRYYELGDVDYAEKIDSLLYSQGYDRKAQNKIELGDLDNPDYCHILNHEFEEVLNQNMNTAYEVFRFKLAELDTNDLNHFYSKVMNNVVVIRLDVANAKDAYKLFETINNRGLALSPTDIIKNFLLGHASQFDDDTLTKVRSNWQKLIVNLDGINSDDFFRQYLAGTLRHKITSSRLIDEFKNYYLARVKGTENLNEYRQYQELLVSNPRNVPKILRGDSQLLYDIAEFSSELATASEKYAELVDCRTNSSEINYHLLNLRKILSQPVYSYLLPLFRMSSDEKYLISILKLLETFMLRRNVCEYRTGELDDIFPALVSTNKQSDVNHIKLALKPNLPSNQEFAEKLPKQEFKGKLKDRAKYILEQIEYYLTGLTEEKQINFDKKVHLEHIIPQSIDTKASLDEFGDWKTYLGENSVENHKIYINLIGNLALLGHILNVKASNNPYHAKINEYKKSEIKLIHKIINDYSEFRFPEVSDRSNKLTEIALKIWSF